METQNSPPVTETLEVEPNPGARNPSSASSTEEVDKLFKYLPTVKRFGQFEFVLGLLTFILGLIALTQSSYFKPGAIAPAVWIGLLICALGVVALFMKRNNLRSLYIANIVVGILTTLASGALFCFSIVLAIEASNDFESKSKTALTVMYAVIVPFAFIGFVLALMHVLYCIAGVYRNGELWYEKHLILRRKSDDEGEKAIEMAETASGKEERETSGNKTNE